MEDSTEVYPIGIVTQLTGLSQRQIRYYESAGLISPKRTRGRQRLYSTEEIETLSVIKTLLGQGLTLQGVQNFLRSHTPSHVKEMISAPFQPDLARIMEGLQKKSAYAKLLNPVRKEHGAQSAMNIDTDPPYEG